MCTLIFIPGDHSADRSFWLGMNRDEARSRAPAKELSQEIFEDRKTALPRDGQAGGTWIGVNDHFELFSLMNHHPEGYIAESKTYSSRGEIIPNLLQAISPSLAFEALEPDELKKYPPFHLFFFDLKNMKIRSLCWDTKKTLPLQHSWKPQIWISSGFDYPGALEVRNQLFQKSLNQLPAERLLTLHDSQKGVRGICMHAELGSSVSSTIIEGGADDLRLRYYLGQPCQAQWPTPDRQAVLV